jgi:hypothetical protein
MFDDRYIGVEPKCTNNVMIIVKFEDNQCDFCRSFSVINCCVLEIPFCLHFKETQDFGRKSFGPANITRGSVR